MSEYPPPPVWQTLPREQRRGVMVMLGQMALRQLRHTSLVEETADERGGSCAASRRHRAEKIHRQHRERLAIAYIRQSTVQQVERHQQSTRLQYALVDRALQFGWCRETIVVIDMISDDQARPG
jgi:hypothetical protein